MWWRVRRKDWERGRGAPNKRALKALVRGGAVPGLIAYVDAEPAAWCAFEPRECYPVLARSRILEPVDTQAVWSVTCFFVAPARRGQGLTERLLRAAARSAAASGARILEGYPHDLGGGSLPGAFVHTGLASAFERVGFREVARRSPKRPILRKLLRRPSRG